MPDVNLLPREDREKERKELEHARKNPKHVDIALTNPPKPESIDLKKPKLPTLSFWDRLFGKPKSLPKVAPPPPKGPLAPMHSAPSLLPVTQKKEPEKIIAKVSQAPKPSFWSRLFGKYTTVKIPAPKAPEGAKKAPADAPNPFVKGPNLLDASHPPHPDPLPKGRGDSSEAPKPPKPIPPAPPQAASPKINLNTGDHAQLSTIPKGNRVKFTQVHTEEKKPQDSSGVSLLPQELRPKDGEVETKLIITIIASVVFASALVGAGLYIVNILKIGAETELAKVMDQTNAYNNQVAQKIKIKEQGTVLQEAIARLQSLLDRHVYWTKWFAVLEQTTHASVQWTKFTYNTKDRVVDLEGVGDSFLAVAEQIVAWRTTPQIESVVITGAARSDTQDEQSSLLFKAHIILKDQYSIEEDDPEKPGTKRTITRGVLTTSAQEAATGAPETSGNTTPTPENNSATDSTLPFVPRFGTTP